MTNETMMFRANDCPIEDCHFQRVMKACPYANAVETCPKVAAAKRMAEGVKGEASGVRSKV